MEEREARRLVVNTGIELLEAGLLVRTWGNISCRLDEAHMVITPSGLSYHTLKEEDLPVYELQSGEWMGPYKPSSEKRIHAAAYEIFPEADFVIHTHQAYASAIAVHGYLNLEITPDEDRQLGGLGYASYGLPGTKKLKKAVELAMKAGSHTVLMQNHGLVIAAADKEEAVFRARLLEKICRRNCKGLKEEGDETPGISQEEKKGKHRLVADCIVEGRGDYLLKMARQHYPYAELVTTDAVILQAADGIPVEAQLDDMAQMIGSHIPVVRNKKTALAALKKYHAALVPGLGGLVAGEDKDDTDALRALMEKACIAARHTEVCHAKTRLNAADAALMHLVYKKKYAREKDRKQRVFEENQKGENA